MLDHEAQLAAGDLDAGIKLGTAIADWSALGGYELEGAVGRRLPADRARAVCRASPIVPRSRCRAASASSSCSTSCSRRTPTSCSSTSPTTSSTCPRSSSSSGRSASSKKTVLMISHDRAVLSGGGQVDRDPGGQRRLGTRRLVRDLSRRRARSASAASATRVRAVARRGAPPLPVDEDVQGAGRYSSDWAKKADAAETRWRRFRDDGPAPGPGHRLRDQGPDARR